MVPPLQQARSPRAVPCAPSQLQSRASVPADFGSTRTRSAQARPIITFAGDFFCSSKNPKTSVLSAFVGIGVALSLREINRPLVAQHNVALAKAGPPNCHAGRRPGIHGFRLKAGMTRNHVNNSSDKSTNSGFSFSINSIFHLRRHHFSCFSR